jgi:hypothetical protein
MRAKINPMENILSFLKMADAWSDFCAFWVDNGSRAVEVAIFIVLLVFIAGLSLSFLVSMLLSRKREQEFATMAATVRVYRIDTKNDAVVYFNLNNLSHVHKTNLATFFSGFPEKEQPRVREWISTISEGKNTSDYLTTDIILHHYMHKRKRFVLIGADRGENQERIKTKVVFKPSFLRLVKTSPNGEVFHLESYLLNYEVPDHYLRKTPSTEGDFSLAVKANGANSGMTFCFLLGPERNVLDKGGMPLKSDSINVELSRRFRESLEPFVYGNQRIITCAPNEVVIANFDMLDTSQAIAYALEVMHYADSVLVSLRRNFGSYKVFCGIVQNKDLLGDSDLILSESRHAAESAFDYGNTIFFYKKGSQEYSPVDEQHYRSEVERLIFEKRLAYSFRPVFSVDKFQINGYLLRVLPVDSSFATIDELKNYAARAKDEKSLFAAIAKNTLPSFSFGSKDPGQFLYFPVRMSERALIAPCFQRLQLSKKLSICFLFREDDIVSSLDNAGVPSFIADIAILHQMGYKFGLVLAGKSLTLGPEIYSQADCFFVDFASSGGDGNMDTRIRSALHALVERLLKYNKPIVATNLLSWNGIELVVGSGLNYISGDLFAPYESMPNQVPEKSLQKLKLMKERK